MVRKIVRQADPRVPVTDVKTEAAQVDQIMNQEIVFARLCSAFAIVALVDRLRRLYRAGFLRCCATHWGDRNQDRSRRTARPKSNQPIRKSS